MEGGQAGKRKSVRFTEAYPERAGELKNFGLHATGIFKGHLDAKQIE